MVTIGFTGTYTDEMAEGDGMALAGQTEHPIQVEAALADSGLKGNGTPVRFIPAECKVAGEEGRSENAGGFYKVEMHTVHGSRRGVIYVYDGKMMGGSSAFAFIGTYPESPGGEVLADILTLRHNEDRNFQPLLKADIVTLSLKGRQRGEQYFFEGGTTQLPSIAFYAVMTPISGAAAPPSLRPAKTALVTASIPFTFGCLTASMAAIPAS